jgi:hypothetical protein
MSVIARPSKGKPFGGLVVSMLASGTLVRGFKPGRSRRIFQAKKSSTCRPLEEKLSRLSHVTALRHVKEPRNYMEVGLYG